MGDVRIHKSRALLTWIMEHPDTPLTVEAMARAVDWNKNSASTAASKLVQQHPEHLERVGSGVYVWRSSGVAPGAPEDQPVKELFLRVIKHRSTGDGAMLAEDVEHPDRLFVVTPFEF